MKNMQKTSELRENNWITKTTIKFKATTHPPNDSAETKCCLLKTPDHNS